MAWFRKEKAPKQVADPDAPRRVRISEDLFLKCNGCGEIIYKKEIIRNLSVCPKCNYHFRIRAAERLRLLFDGGAFEVLHGGLVALDPLKFKDTKTYADRLQDYRARTEMNDALLTGLGKMNGLEVVLSAMEYE